MPKIAEWKMFVFFFYSYDLKERPHLHVAKQHQFNTTAKIWLTPNIELFSKGNLTAKESREVLAFIRQNEEYFLSVYDMLVQGKNIKPKRF